MKRYLYAALACAAFPLVGSVLIYLLWLATGTPWGQPLLWTVLTVSVVALPIGFLSLVIYSGLPDEEEERTRGQLISQVTVMAILLILGPILCLLLARHIRSRDAHTDAHTEAASQTHLFRDTPALTRSARPRSTR